MKNILLILLSTIVLLSCKKEEEKPLPNTIKGLKIEKNKLEKSKDSLSVLIVKIDKKLAKLDTVKKLQLVSVVKIEPSYFEHYISIQGNTMTDKNIIVRPQSNGLITKVYVKEGQRVSNGQILFQIDDAILQNSIFEIKNQLILANTTFERQKRLWDQKIGSEMQFLQAKNNKEILENKITTLNAQLKSYKVFAPFNGIIDNLIANKGDLATSQTPLLQIINLNNMYIESDVSENYLKNIKKGNKAIVKFESLGREITTKVAQIGNYIDPENRSFKIRININNRNGTIKPNLLADIKLKDFDAKNAIVIPNNLVQIDGKGKEFVYILKTKDSINIALKRTIKTKSTYQDMTLIIAGLELDEILITEGSRFISNNQEIEILE
ncbi:MAG: efflux RND transporter periplasmic adaptor subunit [Flavobacteriaceae bacterium]|nr:efflux RND transporter periplasmic adaptor subunit [Flavobacteriaceae bacterium]